MMKFENLFGKTFLSIILSALSFSILYCQENLKFDTVSTLKAEYLDGDLERILGNYCNYPIEGPMNNVKGDVILSLLISSEGHLDSIEIVESPHIALTTSSLEAIGLLSNSWKPSHLDSIPIEKRYHIVFRFRMYTGPIPDNTAKANKAISSKDFKAALRYYNRAIKDNSYNSQLYLMRSLINKELGKNEKSETDLKYSILLQNNILAIIDVIIIGVTREA